MNNSHYSQEAFCAAELAAVAKAEAAFNANPGKKTATKSAAAKAALFARKEAWFSSEEFVMHKKAQNAERAGRAKEAVSQKMDAVDAFNHIFAC